MSTHTHRQISAQSISTPTWHLRITFFS